MSGSFPALWRVAVADAWDFSGVNNYVAPWIGIERLNPDRTQREFLKSKYSNLPLFFDPNAGLIRWGVRHADHQGDFSMSWQNFTFSLETLKTLNMVAPEMFNPALSGQFLLSADGLIELAHNVDYIFPQWFDPYKKISIIQQDVKSLDIVYEPWQTGTFAYLMAQAYELSGDKKYLDEAMISIEKLLSGDLEFTVKNDYYDITYNDPVDFPIAEIFGNGWGIAAGQKIHELTGNEKYLQYSKDFLNNLLRATFWYESELEVDPKDLILKNAGLFKAHGDYLGAAPWETISYCNSIKALIRL